MSPLSKEELAVAKQLTRLLEVKAAANVCWVQVDRETLKLVRVAKLGRKSSIVVRTSETHGVEISNQFRGEVKVFAPAFARKWRVKEVRLA